MTFINWRQVTFNKKALVLWHERVPSPFFLDFVQNSKKKILAKIRHKLINITIRGYITLRFAERSRFFCHKSSPVTIWWFARYGPLPSWCTGRHERYWEGSGEPRAAVRSLHTARHCQGLSASIHHRSPSSGRRALSRTYIANEGLKGKDRVS